MKAGKITNFLLLTFFIFIMSACYTLQKGIYLSIDKSKVIKLDQDSIFIFWSDSPLLIGNTVNRYADGFFQRYKNTIILNSLKKDKIGSIQFIESKKVYRTKYDNCQNYLIHFEVERSNFTMLPRVSIKVISETDTTSYHFASDSLLLVNCHSSNSLFDLDEQILIRELPYNNINKVIFIIDNLEYQYELTNKSANALDIYIYNQKYDTLEYREFSREVWEVKRNRLIDIKNDEIYKFESDRQNSKSWGWFLDNRYIFNHQ